METLVGWLLVLIGAVTFAGLAIGLPIAVVKTLGACEHAIVMTRESLRGERRRARRDRRMEETRRLRKGTVERTMPP